MAIRSQAGSGYSLASEIKTPMRANFYCYWRGQQPHIFRWRQWVINAVFAHRAASLSNHDHVLPARRIESLRLHRAQRGAPRDIAGASCMLLKQDWSFYFFTRFDGIEALVSY